MARTKIIAGLGNPGAAYKNTPHSIGFEVVEKLAAAAGASWEPKKAFEASIAKCSVAGVPCILAMPQTFMNLSGNAIAPLVRYSNATAADLIVVQDDIDLPAGKLRIRKSGSAGGHNGIRNIIERLGTQDFIRLKIGVGKDKSNIVGHVLGKFPPDVRKTMDGAVERAVAAVEAVLRDGPDKAMNAVNG